MNHNPHHLQIGDIVILDEGFPGERNVIILDFSPNKAITEINGISEDLSDIWEVGTHRLTPKSKEKHET